MKYKLRKWAKRLSKQWAKRLRVGGRNDSRNGGRNDSGAKRLRAKRLRANGKVGETTRYHSDNRSISQKILLKSELFITQNVDKCVVYLFLKYGG